MSTIRVTKEFHFEMAHALYGYDGACKNIHGHSYHLSVTVAGKPITEEGHTKLGMVLDFGDLKKIVKDHITDVYDHALLVNAGTPHASLDPTAHGFGDKLILAPFQPTCENMVVHFAGLLKKHLPPHITLTRLILRETPTSFVEWLAEDNQ